MLALLAVSCNKNQKADSSSDLIGKSDIKVEDGRFTPDVMWALGKMGETAVSPDGSQLAYTVTYYNMDENRGNSEVYLMPTAGGEAVQLTKTPQGEFSPAWLDDGTLMFCRGPLLSTWQPCITGVLLL